VVNDADLLRRNEGVKAVENADEELPNVPKRGIVFFAKEDARILEETDVMTPARIDPAVYRNIDIRPIGAGTRSMVLFQGEGSDGFSLITSTMKAGYRLPRHTHSGDCVYLITKGSVFVGRREITEGSGFLVKSGQPYTYTVGEQGAALVEFRSTTTFDMEILDQTVAKWKPLVDVAIANQERWAEEPFL
jgi:quercetin dioxygenase-like cupin family protein